MEHGGAPRTLSAGGGADLEKPLPAADLKALRRTLDSRPLRFADAADLERLLGLLPGQVTPLGALRAPAGTVTVVLDASLRGRTVGVHPLENTATTFLNLDDLAALLEDHGVPVIWCPL